MCFRQNNPESDFPWFLPLNSEKNLEVPLFEELGGNALLLLLFIRPRKM